MAKPTKLNQDFYDKHYARTQTILEKEKQVSYLLNRLDDKYFDSKFKVLDVGCGIGMLASKIKSLYSSQVFGIDISTVGIKHAKKLGVNAKIADIEKKWPYENAYFDQVVSMQVLEHILNPDFFLEEARRVLKKNGILIVTTPNLAVWFNRLIFLLGYQPFFTEVSTVDKTLGLSFTRSLTKNREPLGHIRVFTLKAVEDILKLHKFEVVEALGGRVQYLPKPLNILDSLFSYFPSLATDLIVVARKK